MKFTFLALAGLVLGGCTTLGNQKGIDMAGPKSVVDKPTKEILDLQDRWELTEIQDWLKDENGNKLEIDKLLAKYHNDKSVSEPERIRLRNELQSRLLNSSEHLCGRYTAYLFRNFSSVNFGLGVAGTISAAFGSLLPNVNTAKAWSGLSGVLQGTRAEYNQDYFANLTVNVITEGIEAKRREVLKQIYALRTEGATEYSKYNLNDAIRHAFEYHNNCSMVAGLQQASAAIRYEQDPGIDGMMRAAAKMKALNALNEGNVDQYTKFSAIAIGPKLATAVVATTAPEKAPLSLVFEHKSQLNELTRLSKSSKDLVDKAACLDEKDAKTLLAGIENISKAESHVKLCSAQAIKINGDLEEARANLKTNLTDPDANGNFVKQKTIADNLLKEFEKRKTTSQVAYTELDTSLAKASVCKADKKLGADRVKELAAYLAKVPAEAIAACK